MVISQIPVKFIFHSYSQSSTFGRPGLGRSTPIWVAISLIPTLTTLISFLLWELIIWQSRSWHIYPPIQWWFHRFLLWQLTTLRAQHLADQFLADVTPHIRWQIHRFLVYSESSYMADWELADQHPLSYGNFTDCCSDSSYFIPTLTAPHLADQVLADLLPLINGNFTDSYSTLRAHIWQTKCWQIYPHIKWQFHRSLWNSYFIPTLRAHHLADQVLTDLPPSNGDFTESCFDSSVVWELIIWQTRSWQIYPHIKRQFHRFHRFHSYSESSTFGWPSVGRSTPP